MRWLFAFMPSSAPRRCNYVGCGALVSGTAGRCADHAYVQARSKDRARGTANQRGYTYKWQQAREGFLRAHPLCALHELKGLIVLATVVDHIVPHRGDKFAFWQRKNWQPLCKPCHDQKTAEEDGGFGR